MDAIITVDEAQRTVLYNRAAEKIFGFSRAQALGEALMVMLGSMNAEERLATFLLNLSQRLLARGYSASEFHLRMSRAEIGSYLGLKLETVSRTFSAFQQQRLLEVDKRHIRITDIGGLQRAFELQVH